MKPQTIISVFYAHSASEKPEEIEKTKKGIKEIVAQKWVDWKREEPGTRLACGVTAGRDDFNRYFKGDWSEWAESISKRRNATTGKRMFDMIIVPNEWVGRATAQMINAAVVIGMPVFLFQDGSLQRITQVRAGDPEDWQAGFQLELPLKEASHG